MNDTPHLDFAAQRWRTAVALFLLVSIPTSLAIASEVRYTLSPALERDSLTALEIEMRFRGEADGETRLLLPDSWGGKTRLYEGIRDLSVEGGGAKIPPQGDSASRTIRHAPGTSLTVRYRVVQYWDGPPAVTGSNEYRPVVQARYFHAIGNAIFARPEGDSAMRARFAWDRIPSGWTVASDLEHGDGPLSMDDLLSSVSVGGDFRVLERGKLRVALRGRWSFSDEEFVARLEQIADSHRRFFEEGEEPFLVTVLPLAALPGQYSLGGTGLGDAFAFFADENAELATLTRILAHEHLHTWIPGRLGAMPETDEAADYWFSEGFTDFYAFRLLLREGLWGLEEFLGAMNGVLREYARSPVRTAPNEKIVADFWRDSATNQLPYQRGFLLAALWDGRVRETTRGAQDLDDVMRALRTSHARERSTPTRATVALAHRLRDLGVDIDGELRRYVERGEAILWPAALLAPAILTTEEVAEYDRGFDAEKTVAGGNVIVGLDRDHPAYRAGLRDGMKILKRESGSPGDSRVPLRYRVLDGETERVIEYLPEGKRSFTLQEVSVPPAIDAAGRRAIVERLAGSEASRR